MDMTGEYRIPAPRQRVWEALNDPEILKAAIPGCEELNLLPGNEMEARVKAKVGPVSATFTGKVTLNDLNPPESYRIAGEGKGGAAGFAKGGAEVNLAEDGADTILRYSAKADVGGKLAQIGSRLIQGTAKKMADDFFGKFSAIVGERFAAEYVAAAPPAPAVSAPMAPPVPPTPAPRQVAFTPERPVAPTAPAPSPPMVPAASGRPWYVWLGGLIILVILLFWLFG
jgi:carbon monoxide dehydrogenase subunit G